MKKSIFFGTCSPAFGPFKLILILLVFSVSNMFGAEGDFRKSGSDLNVEKMPPCLTVSPASKSVSATAGSTTFSVSTLNNSYWTASENASWLTVSPTWGSPNGVVMTLTANFAENLNLNARTATITISAGCGSTVTVTVTQQGNTQCTNGSESANNSLSSAPVLTLPATKISQIGSSGDEDYWKFVIPSGWQGINVSLTNLPFDYDLLLKNSSGVLVAWSTNDNTMDENIIDFPVQPGATYYAHIFGYNGAFSNTQCYNLQITPQVFFAGSNDRSSVAPLDWSKKSNENLDFTIQPNPASGSTEIQTDYPNEVEVEVFNQIGQSIFKTRGAANFIWDVSQEPNGVYFVKMIAENDLKVKQVSVAH